MKNQNAKLISSNGSNYHSTKRFGFWTAATLLIGSVVGTGIFFKNSTVLQNTGFGWLTIVAWFVAGISVLLMAFAYSEVSSIELKTNSGVYGWSRAFLGKRLGNVIGWSQLIWCFPVEVGTIAFYAADYTVRYVINSTTSSPPENIWLIILLTFIYLIWFLVMNTFFVKPGKYYQIFVTVIKFLPIIIVVVFGLMIVPANGGNISNAFPYQPDANFHYKDGNAFLSFMPALAPILFAYNSFLNVGNISKETKNPRKNIPLVISLGILAVMIIYTLVSIATLSAYANPNQANIPAGSQPGYIGAIIQQVLGGNIAAAKILGVFLVLAALGVLNGITMASIRLGQSMVDEKQLVFIPLLKNKKPQHERLIGGIIFSVFALIWCFIPFAVVGFNYGARDGGASTTGPLTNVGFYYVIDNFSNVPILFFFFIYAAIVLGAIVNRFTKKVDVIKKPWFWPTAIGSTILIFFITIFDIVYQLAGQQSIFITILLAIGILIMLGGFINYELLKKYRPQCV